jgi:hypothetical protein
MIAEVLGGDDSRQGCSAACDEALRKADDVLGRTTRSQKRILAHDEQLEALEERVCRLEKLLAAQGSGLRK